MRQLRYLVTVVIALGLICTPVFGQNQSTEKKKEMTSSEGKPDIKESAKTTGTYLQQKKEQYQKKTEEKLHRFEAKVTRLYVRAEKKSAAAREKISRAADRLRKKSEAAKNKLSDLKDSGEEKWDKAKAELDTMLSDLERSYHRTAAKFKD
ncbi:MAG: hypothetical protein HZB31_01355 [Nitrospirae bacterium]|nr:hypothetical protein [Nitrospirota bacterium]